MQSSKLSSNLFLPHFRMGVEAEVDACGQLTMSGSTIGSNTVDDEEDNDADADDTDETTFAIGLTGPYAVSLQVAGDNARGHSSAVTKLMGCTANHGLTMLTSDGTGNWRCDHPPQVI